MLSSLLQQKIMLSKGTQTNATARSSTNNHHLITMVNPSSSTSSISLEDDHNLRLSDATDASMDILANLEAPDSEAGHLLFESTSSGTTQVEIVERMLIDSTRGSSIISADMDDEVHRMSSSMHDLSFDPVYQYDGCEAGTSTRRNSLFLDGCDLGFHNPSRRASLVDTTHYTRRGRSPPATPNRPRKRISVKDVDFDPNPSSSYDAQNQLDDLSICSFNTAQTSQDNPLNSSFNSLLATNPDEQAKYHSALASLAESMKKTESSRLQVLISFQTQEQRASLEEARNRQLQAIQTETEALIPVETARELSPARSSIMDQFFAGSRSTLTNGLEQSRRQLKSYMSQVQNQTL